MDEIVEQFQNTLVTPKDTEKYSDLYKNWGRLGGQEERRKELLEHQKSDRQRTVDKFRGIFTLIHEPADSEWGRDYRRRFKPTIYVAGFYATANTYRNVLMLSEWLIEKPEDFGDAWYMMPCPKGKRAMLIAYRGSTLLYDKYGHFMFELRTALPGGSTSDIKYVKNCCVLDGVYVEGNNTFYVLDLLSWNDQNMTDGEAEFRQYWLDSQLDNYPNTKIESRRNQIIITQLPTVDCNTNSLNEFFKEYPLFENNYPALDGFLFYHKKGHYVSGETPLVGWLFPYMINEVLGTDIIVHPSYLRSKPLEYVDQATFIKNFENKTKHKKLMLLSPKARQIQLAAEKKAKKNSEMDSSEETTEEANSEIVEENTMEVAIEPAKSPEEVVSPEARETDTMEVADTQKTEKTKSKKKGKGKKNRRKSSEKAKESTTAEDSIAD